jgi:hypothetical protein
VKAPQGLDPDVRTVLEIVQHAGEILSRIPLAALRAHLEQRREDDAHAVWFTKALNVCRAAEQLDAAQGILMAEEYRAAPAPPPVDPRTDGIPDDWAVR